MDGLLSFEESEPPQAHTEKTRTSIQKPTSTKKSQESLPRRLVSLRNQALGFALVILTNQAWLESIQCPGNHIDRIYRKNHRKDRLDNRRFFVALQSFQ